VARRKRAFSTFSLSFIDCMSCGLGAVILLFMIINHSTEVRAVDTHRDVAARLSLVEDEVLEKRQAQRELAAALEETEKQRKAAQAQAASLQQALDTQPDTRPPDDSGERIASLQDEVRSLEAEVKSLRERQQAQGDAIRDFQGEGQRQYLTGLVVEGRRILILADVSASMLADSIVDVIRLRNMSDSRRQGAEKWQRALRTVDWLTAQMPASAQFQLYAFNTKTRATIAGTDGKWLSAAGGARLSEAVRGLRATRPENGTSLHNAFAAAAKLSPRPDQIYLVTDGLPTQDAAARNTGAVSGNDRLKLFNNARGLLPGGVPVNVILLPIEGDPLASASYWALAQQTGGAFLSPSRDWP
jgi:hypothetical protein